MSVGEVLISGGKKIIGYRFHRRPREIGCHVINGRWLLLRLPLPLTAPAKLYLFFHWNNNNNKEKTGGGGGRSTSTKDEEFRQVIWKVIPVLPLRSQSRSLSKPMEKKKEQPFPDWCRPGLGPAAGEGNGVTILLFTSSSSALMVSFSCK